MKVRSSFLILCCFLASFVWAQAGPGSPPATPSGAEGLTGLTRSYRVGAVPSTRFQNSNRSSALIKDGKLYLSLQDAIALALENNLDIELERYGPRMADTDLWRAQAGSLLRGVPLSVQEGPQGTGGPVETPPGSAPPLTPSSSTILDTSVNQAQTDLSITGSTPLSAGTARPVFRSRSDRSGWPCL